MLENKEFKKETKCVSKREGEGEKKEKEKR